MRSIIIIALVFAPTLAAVYYIRYGRDRPYLLAQEREAAASAEGEISVAVIWPSDKRSFLRGVKLALDEINQAGGAPIRTSDGNEYRSRFRLRYFDEPDVESGVAAARYVTSDPQTLVAIGHDTPSAMRASIIYNSGGVLFLAPTSLDRTLTQHGFASVFRMAPDARQHAAAMVGSLGTLLPPKRIRVAVLYPDRTENDQRAGYGVPADDVPADDVPADDAGTPAPPVDRGQEFAQYANSLLESVGDRVRLEVVFSQAYDPDHFDRPETLARLREHTALYDVALILDVLPVASNWSEQLESDLDRIGEDKLILTLDDLDWSNMDSAYAEKESVYADFSPAIGLKFYEPVVQLVLRETKQKVAIIASRDADGKSISSELWSALGNDAANPNHQVTLAVYRSFPPGTQVFSELVAELRDKDVELVFVVGAGADTARLVLQMRQEGLETTVVGGPRLEPYLHFLDADPALDGVRHILQQWLEERGKMAAERASVRDFFRRLRSEHGYRGSEVAVRRFVAETNGRTFAASIFDVNSQNENVRAFVAAFRQKYGDVEIDALAADGYQALHLVANAFRRSQSRDPSATAEALKLFVSEGSFENNRFSPRGEMLDRPIFLNQLMPDGTMQVIPTRRATGTHN